MNKYDRWLIFDDPIPYKDLLIYPATMRDFIKFHIFARCLLLEKNSITDPVLAIQAISMSYLEYLYKTTNPEAIDETNLVALFDGLLRLVLRLSKETEQVYFNSNKKRYLDYWLDKKGKPYWRVGDTIYDAQDFDEIKQIISEQNELELPNELIQKDVRDQIEYARKFKAKLAGTQMAGLEDQIISVSIFTGWDMRQIYDLTIRKFIRTLKRANHMIYQDVYLKAQFSGMVDFKDKSVLKGWLARIDEENDNHDVLMAVDDLQSKVDTPNGVK